MKLLVAHGADPNIPTMQPAGRPRIGDAGAARDVEGRVGPAAGSGRRPRRAAAAGGRRRRLRRRLRRQLALATRRRACCRRSSTWSRSRRRRQRRRSRGQHRAAPRRRARRRRDDPVPRVEGRRRHEASTAKGRPTADMANGPVQRIQPFPKRSRCSRSSARRTTTSACRVDADEETRSPVAGDCSSRSAVAVMRPARSRRPSRRWSSPQTAGRAATAATAAPPRRDSRRRRSRARRVRR